MSEALSLSAFLFGLGYISYRAGIEIVDRFVAAERAREPAPPREAVQLALAVLLTIGGAGATAMLVLAPDRRRFATPPAGIAIEPQPDMSAPQCAPRRAPQEHGSMMAPLSEDTALEAWRSRTDDG